MEVMSKKKLLHLTILIILITTITIIIIITITTKMIWKSTLGLWHYITQPPEDAWTVLNSLWNLHQISGRTMIFSFTKTFVDMVKIFSYISKVGI